MSRGINKVILIGNLGQDPETRFTKSQDTIAQVSLATNKAWTDKQGQKQEATEWHRLVFFGKLAEIVGEHLHKGAPIYVEGELRTRKWADKQGVERWTTEIVVREMTMLGGNGPSTGSARPPAPPLDDEDVPF